MTSMAHHGVMAIKDDEAVLIELQQVLARAWVTHDRETVERIIAPEWRSTGPDGSAADRARVLSQIFETGAHKILENRFLEQNAPLKRPVLL